MITARQKLIIAGMIRISQRDGLSKLQEIYNADQTTRKAYVKYLNKHGNNWREAVTEWLLDNPQFKEGMFLEINRDFRKQEKSLNQTS